MTIWWRLSPLCAAWSMISLERRACALTVISRGNLLGETIRVSETILSLSHKIIADAFKLGQAMKMSLAARLSVGETIGDRVMKVDHAGEHGAVCVYLVQRWFARWRAPEMLVELDHFIAHEKGHRTRFQDELTRRGRSRCRSYFWCGLGGGVLGAITGIAGRNAIAATTVAIERIVLQHMHAQIEHLLAVDEAAVGILRTIVAEEQEHHDLSVRRLGRKNIWSTIINPIVGSSTEAVIWLGMNLRLT